MFEINKTLATKIVLAVTFIVSLNACSATRKKLDDGEKRIVPQSEFGPGESWRDQNEAPQLAATKDSFRSRVKKSGVKPSRKSIVSQR